MLFLWDYKHVRIHKKPFAKQLIYLLISTIFNK